MLGYLWGEGSFISDLAMGQRQQRQLDKDDDLSITPAIMGIVTLRIGCYPQTQKACLGVQRIQRRYLSFTTSLMVVKDVADLAGASMWP